MGTKVEYIINVLAPSQKRSRFSVDESESESEYYSESQGLNHSFQITGFEKYQNSINMPEKHNIDFIRKTMQIHDDIFKQQVRELHRVYSVQKMLMEEMKKKKNKKQWNHMNSKNEYRLREEGENMSPTERSGSCSGDIQTIMKIKTKTTGSGGRGFDLERAAEEDVSTGVISRIEGDEAEIELTLSIGSAGRSTKKFKNEIQLQQQDQSSTPTTPISATNFDQERKHPHWLFQGLTINRTSSSTG